MFVKSYAKNAGRLTYLYHIYSFKWLFSYPGDMCLQTNN